MALSDETVERACTDWWNGVGRPLAAPPLCHWDDRTEEEREKTRAFFRVLLAALS